MGKADFSGEEKRRVERRPILDTFSIFASVPKKADIRLPIHDLSELGIGFDLDTGHGEDLFPVKEGDELEIHLYLNQSLFVPATVTIKRILKKDSVRQIGAELQPQSAASQTVKSFVAFLDAVVGHGQVTS